MYLLNKNVYIGYQYVNIYMYWCTCRMFLLLHIMEQSLFYNIHAKDWDINKIILLFRTFHTYDKWILHSKVYPNLLISLDMAGKTKYTFTLCKILRSTRLWPVCSRFGIAYNISHIYEIDTSSHRIVDI